MEQPVSNTTKLRVMIVVTIAMTIIAIAFFFYGLIQRIEAESKSSFAAGEVRRIQQELKMCQSSADSLRNKLAQMEK